MKNKRKKKNELIQVKREEVGVEQARIKKTSIRIGLKSMLFEFYSERKTVE